MAGWYQYFLGRVGRAGGPSGTLTIGIGATATFDVTAPVDSSSEIVFLVSGSLDALILGEISGSASITFESSANPARISAYGEITFISTGTIRARGSLSASPVIRFLAQASTIETMHRRTKACRTVVSLDSGRKVRVRAQRLAGAGVYTVPHASGIAIRAKGQGED